MTKRVASLREAIEKSGLQDGMCISFHHHLRGGDYVLNMVLDEIADMGIRNLTVNASSLFDCHMPLAEHIRRGVVTGLETDYVSAGIGRELSSGILEKPVIFRTHGTRPSDIASGKCHIDVAFVAAPTSDEMGNCTGKLGPSACGICDVGCHVCGSDGGNYGSSGAVSADPAVDYGGLCGLCSKSRFHR